MVHSDHREDDGATKDGDGDHNEDDGANKDGSYAGDDENTQTDGDQDKTKEKSSTIGFCTPNFNLLSEESEPDPDFEEIIAIILQGYKLKKSDWIKKKLDVVSALQEIGAKRIRISDSEKLDKILTRLEDLDRRLEVIEHVMKINVDKKEKGQSSQVHSDHSDFAS
ncbi:unnamed protein product [Arabidopsis arenosa]|uniref:Uncharacterized protein n=1 Tax=Arabidopsis arenosa TaxID=38785 RepID=A0A8S2B1N3_ARAAE|nr:unnamed protein product [Arabidopsis arenosa]